VPITKPQDHWNGKLFSARADLQMTAR